MPSEHPTRQAHDSHHGHDHEHGHSHAYIDPLILETEKGIWAVKWSFFILMLTAIIQSVVVVLSGSVALLSDTIHNFADAATAVPLGIAFLFALKKPTKRFTYGLGRVEDLAGLAIIATVFFSAVAAGYSSVIRLLHPQVISHIGAVAAASVVGFLGNEGVAIFRIQVGKKIGSAALVADGYHARVDGITSLAVLVGALGVKMGYPLADPIVGLLITVAILRITWSSIKTIFIRLLDGVESDVVDEIMHAINHVEGVKEVSDVRARWIGHRLHAEVNVSVASELSVTEGHAIAKEVHHQLLRHVDHLSGAVIHVDPANESGEKHHTGKAEAAGHSGHHLH